MSATHINAHSMTTPRSRRRPPRDGPYPALSPVRVVRPIFGLALSAAVHVIDAWLAVRRGDDFPRAPALRNGVHRHVSQVTSLHQFVQRCRIAPLIRTEP